MTKANIRIKEEIHTITLNCKVGTEGITLEKIKQQLVKTNEKILKCTADNIPDN